MKIMFKETREKRKYRVTIIAVMVFIIYTISGLAVFIAARKGDVRNDRNGQ